MALLWKTRRAGNDDECLLCWRIEAELFPKKCLKITTNNDNLQCTCHTWRSTWRLSRHSSQSFNKYFYDFEFLTSCSPKIVIRMNFLALKTTRDQMRSKLPWWPLLARNAQKVAVGLLRESITFNVSDSKNPKRASQLTHFSVVGFTSCRQFLPYTCCCAQYALRYKALDGDMKRYSCFQVVINRTTSASYEVSSTRSYP